MAFDSVRREFVANFMYFGPAVACERAGFDGADTDALMAKTLNEGAAMDLSGVPSHLQVLAADAVRATWFSISGVDDSIGPFAPGGPLG